MKFSLILENSGTRTSLGEHCKDLDQCNWQNEIKAGDKDHLKFLNQFRTYWLLDRGVELVVGHDNAV